MASSIEMDANEQWYIDSLKDSSAPESDQFNSIEVLEVLLSLDAIPILVQVLSDETRSFALRRRAAEAIHAFAADIARDALIQLGNSESKIIRELARVAM